MDAAGFKQKAQPSCAHLLCNDECDPSSAHCGRITEVFDEHNRKVHLMPSPPPDMIERARVFLTNAKDARTCIWEATLTMMLAFAQSEREAAMEGAAKIAKELRQTADNISPSGQVYPAREMLAWADALDAMRVKAS